MFDQKVKKMHFAASASPLFSLLDTNSAWGYFQWISADNFCVGIFFVDISRPGVQLAANIPILCPFLAPPSITPKTALQRQKIFSKTQKYLGFENILVLTTQPKTTRQYTIFIICPSSLVSLKVFE